MKKKKSNGEPQPLSLTATMYPDGRFEVRGPMNDPVAYLGLVGLAHQRLISMMVQKEIMAVMRQAEKEKSSILTADGVRFNKKP